MRSATFRMHHKRSCTTWSSVQGYFLQYILKQWKFSVSCCFAEFCAGLTYYAKTVYIEYCLHTAVSDHVAAFSTCLSQQTWIYVHLCLRPMERVCSTSHLLLLVMYQITAHDDSQKGTEKPTRPPSCTPCDQCKTEKKCVATRVCGGGQ